MDIISDLFENIPVTAFIIDVVALGIFVLAIWLLFGKHDGGKS